MSMSEDMLRRLQADDMRLRQTEAKEVSLSGAGTAFPSAPVTGMRFWRTDLGFECYYDGTRWLTVHEYDANFNQNATAFTGTASYVIEPIRQDYAPYVMRVTLEYIVIGTNNGTNYWNISLRGASSNYGATTTIDTFTTSAAAGTTWTPIDRVPNTTQAPANRALFDLAVSIGAGAPGSLVAAATLYYRLIIT